MRITVPILTCQQGTPDLAPDFQKYAVTPKQLGEQMLWLAYNSYTAITPDELIDFQGERGGLARRPIMITFDDGYSDCVRYAVPILRKHGFKAIIYIVTSRVGKLSDWLGTQRMLKWPLADWTELRHLSDIGFVCGVHSHNHNLTCHPAA